MDVGISGKDFATEIRVALERGAAPDPPAGPRGRALSLTTVLVVVGVIGLAAVVAAALAGAGSSQSASDSRAKVDARYAQTAIEVFSLDHGGRYADATPGALERIDSSLPEGVVVTAGADSYTITVPSSAGENRFSITRDSDGRARSTCTTAGTGACPPSGRWD